MTITASSSKQSYPHFCSSSSHVSDTSDVCLSVIPTHVAARLVPFADDCHYSRNTFGEMFGQLFLQLSGFCVLLGVLLLISVLTFLMLLLSSSFHFTNGFFHILRASDLTKDSYHIVNCVACIYLFSVFLVFRLTSMTCRKIREDSINSVNDLNCLKSFNAIFSYRWNYTGKFDVEYFTNKLSEQLKEEHSLTSQKDNVHFPKLKWVYIVSMPLLLFFIMTIFGIFPTNRLFVSRGNLVRYLYLPLLVCMFNVLGKKTLYFVTKEVLAPERDFRVLYLYTLKLCFFSHSLLPFSDMSSGCFPIEFSIYIFVLFLLTFFFDVIFPFFWYKFRSLSKSFEKPLFDLPLSQSKVFYYFVLSFTAQFYIPTFAIISFPLVYLYGKYLSYSLRKCSRLSSATYNEDELKSCFSTVFAFLFVICSFFSSFLWLLGFLVDFFKAESGRKLATLRLQYE
ncbi:hypothetical protein GEMRC1_005245 [Eukaryota sp. GEM-RC1]